jgi:hypothetical protein
MRSNKHHWDKFYPLLASLIIAALLQTCSGADFHGSTGKGAADNTDENPAEQPTDVAGGFGLTCDPSYEDADPTNAIISCKFSSADGKKFIESEKAKFEVSVSDGQTQIPVNKLPASSEYNFNFKSVKVSVANIKITSQFLNPENGQVIGTEKSESLPQVLTDDGSGLGAIATTVPPVTPTASTTSVSAGDLGTIGENRLWKDVTTKALDGSTSNCSDDRSRCTYSKPGTGFWRTAVFSTDASNKPFSHDSAWEFCEQLDYNGEDDWRLISFRELFDLCKNDLPVGFKKTDQDEYILTNTKTLREKYSVIIPKYCQWHAVTSSYSGGTVNGMTVKTYAICVRN